MPDSSSRSGRGLNFLRAELVALRSQDKCCQLLIQSSSVPNIPSSDTSVLYCREVCERSIGVLTFFRLEYCRRNRGILRYHSQYENPQCRCCARVPYEWGPTSDMVAVSVLNRQKRYTHR